MPAVVYFRNGAAFGLNCVLRVQNATEVSCFWNYFCTAAWISYDTGARFSQEFHSCLQVSNSKHHGLHFQSLLKDCRYSRRIWCPGYPTSEGKLIWRFVRRLNLIHNPRSHCYRTLKSQTWDSWEKRCVSMPSFPVRRVTSSSQGRWVTWIFPRWPCRKLSGHQQISTHLRDHILGTVHRDRMFLTRCHFTIPRIHNP